MATIENIADMYAEKTAAACGVVGDEAILAEAFITGANYMREEISRWRDPGKEKPNGLELVLVKIKTPFEQYGYVYATGRYAINGWQVFGNYSLDESSTLIGWRPIEELVE